MTAELWFVTAILPMMVTAFGVGVYLVHEAWLKRELEKERAAGQRRP